MASKIWTDSSNPPRSVSDALGIERWELGAAIHKIKAKNGLSPPDAVHIWNDGSVTDAASGDYLGNIYDEI